MVCEPNKEGYTIYLCHPYKLRERLSLGICMKVLKGPLFTLRLKLSRYEGKISSHQCKHAIRVIAPHVLFQTFADKFFE